MQRTFIFLVASVPHPSLPCKLSYCRVPNPQVVKNTLLLFGRRNPLSLARQKATRIFEKAALHSILINYLILGFPGGSDCKESACNGGDQGPSPGSGRSPGEGNGNPLQYSCLENSTGRGAWWATVCGIAEVTISVSPLISVSWLSN